MALSSFTVSLAPKAAILAATTPNPNVSASNTTLASTIEKENLHPVTGERCAAVSDSSATKKRKTNVLATKTIVAKKQKESKEDRMEGKKARSASSSAAKAKKDGKTVRKTTKKPSRRVSPLPRLDEEDVAVRDRLMQADVASRCYELTVSPLADVTQAYDAGFDVNSLLASFTSAESANFRKATSTEPEIRDYFSPSHSGPPARVAGDAKETKVFTTPERRHIYSAFTFTTPSPSSERFRKASRSPSPVPRLDLSVASTSA
ncbi:hypothetical protein B0H14DRAFT_2825307 [Mycena olivaceomarginata]|nr:hypothetical protein B0H14DRAFT_2825307 [Mycena olivaceomarginata]